MTTPREETPGPDTATAMPPRPDTASPQAPAEASPTAGMEREVGDIDDPDAEQRDGALPGRMGGGLAGG